MSLTATPAIAAMRPYSVPRHPAPIDLKLDGNEGPAPAGLVAALSDAIGDEQLRRYPKASGLEQALARQLGIAPERVLVTSGADDALDRACRALLCAGKSLIMPTPTFEMLPRYARIAGADVVPVPWPSGDYPLEAVLAAIDERTAAIAVVTPNNPTGSVASKEVIDRLAAAAPNAALLVDLAYVEFADEDLTAAALAHPNAIVFRTLSKAWGVAGLRVGYAAASAEIVGWLRAAGNPYAVSAPSLALAQQRIETADIAPYVEQVRCERDELTELLNELGARALPSQGNFVFARPSDADWLRDGLYLRPQNAMLVEALIDWLALEDELMTLRVRRPDPRLIKDLVAEAREELGLSNLGGTQSDLAGSPQAQREARADRLAQQRRWMHMGAASGGSLALYLLLALCLRLSRRPLARPGTSPEASS